MAVVCAGVASVNWFEGTAVTSSGVCAITWLGTPTNAHNASHTTTQRQSNSRDDIQ
jgi:hypothetical protein